MIEPIGCICKWFVPCIDLFFIDDSKIIESGSKDLTDGFECFSSGYLCIGLIFPFAFGSSSSLIDTWDTKYFDVIKSSVSNGILEGTIGCVWDVVIVT